MSIGTRIRIHFGPGLGSTFSKCGSEDPDPLLRKGGSEDPDPLFPNVDPRIRIHVKMRWIRKAEKVCTYCSIIEKEKLINLTNIKVRILTQPTTPYHVETEKNSLSKSSTPNYRCPLCDFAASRINVIVMHSKTHSSSKVSNMTISCLIKIIHVKD